METQAGAGNERAVTRQLAAVPASPIKRWSLAGIRCRKLAVPELTRILNIV
jgi:hypothetical protein